MTCLSLSHVSFTCLFSASDATRNRPLIPTFPRLDLVGTVACRLCAAVAVVATYFVCGGGGASSGEGYQKGMRAIHVCAPCCSDRAQGTFSGT